MKQSNSVFLLIMSLSVYALSTFGVAVAQTDSQDNDVLSYADALFSNSNQDRKQALAWMVERNDSDVIAPLIYALRFSRQERNDIATALEKLSGEKLGDDWFSWMLWTQAHPDISPFEEFDTFQSNLFANIDPNFRAFLYPDVDHEIRLEEIVWGGVVKDGIPALTNPRFLPAQEAAYLSENELVFGVEINGDARAYPYRIMDWHEMANDVVGGTPVSLAYCTLCGSGILYDTRVGTRKEPFEFGSSGFLYRSNKLMYDKQTHSLWNQFTGRPVVGKLTGSDIKLDILPLTTSSWKDWLARHPETKVLSLDTGYSRDYSPGRPYGRYFSSNDLMFPALTSDKRLNSKDQVFGLRITGAEKAWPLDDFTGGKVINDRIGIVDIVLVGDTDSQSVRAFRSDGHQFRKHGNTLDKIASNNEIWKVTENTLEGPNGETLSRLPGHLAYWFAWSGYFPDADFPSKPNQEVND